jgi:nitrile hydratase subunit beta
MDTVHDIGGRQGFGPVRWQNDHDEKPFHHEWQARTWAMCMCMFAGWRGNPEVWTLDWFRHVRERIDPIDYLTRNYFDQWAQSLAATLIDNGTIRLEELPPGSAAIADESPRKRRCCRCHVLKGASIRSGTMLNQVKRLRTAEDGPVTTNASF